MFCNSLYVIYVAMFSFWSIEISYLVNIYIYNSAVKLFVIININFIRFLILSLSFRYTFYILVLMSYCTMVISLSLAFVIVFAAYPQHICNPLYRKSLNRSNFVIHYLLSNLLLHGFIVVTVDISSSRTGMACNCTLRLNSNRNQFHRQYTHLCYFIWSDPFL